MKGGHLVPFLHNNKYTYNEYCSWPEDERWELIDGVAYNMSPAPSSRHQGISGELGGLIAGQVAGNFFLPVISLGNETSVNRCVAREVGMQRNIAVGK